MRKTSFIAAAAAVAAFGLTACDVQKTAEGNVQLPKVEVTKKQEGNVDLPKYDVKGPDVNVTTEKKTIEVPKVEVKTAKEKEAQSMGAAPAKSENK